ncbi:MAG: lytic transglycosylase domain-containing protein [Ilumatobacteraceae bacterium]
MNRSMAPMADGRRGAAARSAARRRSALRGPMLLGAALLGAACTSSADSVTLPDAASSTTASSLAATTVPASPTTSVPPSLDSAAGVAAELSAVEAGIRDPGATPEELDALGRRQQLAYRAVNRNPEWDDEILSLVDPVALVPLQFHLDARRAWEEHSAGREPSEPPSVLPAWTIVAPLPAAELVGYYREAEAATGVPWEYLAAIHFQETRMGRISGVSSAGAVGPMQFLPTTWAECCDGDPLVARDAILGAATYLVMRGGPADMQAALYGYNPNSGYVGAVTAYAQNLMADERAYFGYHGWQVLFGTTAGTVRLPVGYASDVEIDVLEYVAENPDDLLERS